MSFADTATLSMICSREKQHEDRLRIIQEHELRVAPVAVIYGANASGKTNLFTALRFAKRLVTSAGFRRSPFRIETFRLDPKTAENPTRFSFDLLIGKNIYSYSFTLNSNTVQEERLEEQKPSSKRLLFSRTNDAIKLGPSLIKNKRLVFAAKGTRSNQLFLTNTVSQKIETFFPIFDWFENKLHLITPNKQFKPLDEVEFGTSEYESLNRILSTLDTGITRIEPESIEFDSLPIQIQDLLKDDGGEKTVRITPPDRNPYFCEFKNGAWSIKRLISYHSDEQGNDVKFSLPMESDGTRRLIDLLPSILKMTAPTSDDVIFVDELDRSLHTLLLRHLVEHFLNGRDVKNKSQLLFTTHDVLLMDQSLFRRDEMWVTERDNQGRSILYSFSDFKDVRSDKDVRKSYLSGRLGGIPRLLSVFALTAPSNASE
jgi:AAA15 family ATPase/GTPase